MTDSQGLDAAESPPDTMENHFEDLIQDCVFRRLIVNDLNISPDLLAYINYVGSFFSHKALFLTCEC